MQTEGETEITRVWEELALPQGGRIVYLVLDGAGGLGHPETGKTALTAARTPNLDELASESSCGLLEQVGPGITPGSGPGHLALFGYDPLRYRIGRGVLSALGVEFPLRRGDVAARLNFATLDQAGRVRDRRAGRITTESNRRLCERLKEQVKVGPAENWSLEPEHWFLEPVSEHRAVLILRGGGLGGDVSDTDPQETGVLPCELRAGSQEGERTADLVGRFLDSAHQVLASEEVANGILLRGFDRYEPLSTLDERFRLKGLCVARYPMYRGLARLLGMAVADPPEDLHTAFDTLASRLQDGSDLYFLHAKKTDAAGEDRDFDRKVAALEEIDRLIPRLVEPEPEVLVVASDHSTPAVMGQHSWHPTPTLIRGQWIRPDPVQRFDEESCLQGALGQRPGIHLMGLALANAGRLGKFGA